MSPSSWGVDFPLIGSNINIPRLWYLFSIGILAFFFGAGILEASMNPTIKELRFPDNLLCLPPRAHALIVDKSQQRLLLFSSENGRLFLERSMICATGEKEGDKTSTGDKKTPEGVYFCKKLLIPPQLGARYGICALPLNYPNFIDRRDHRDGNGIWLHGVNKNRPTKSTQGCVVLGNKDLAYLASHIVLYLTPVVITDHVRFFPATSLEKEREAILSFLENWRDSWSRGDIHSYITCYAPIFSSKGMRLAQWRAYKQKLFDRYHHRMSIQIESPVVARASDYAVITFKQHFSASGHEERGIKRLYLTIIEGKYRIVGEEWIPFSSIRQKWESYAKMVARLDPARLPYQIISASSLPNRHKRRKIFLKAVKALIAKWKASWEEKDLARYVSFYSRRFKAKRMNLEAWKRYKLRTFRRNGPIHLTVKNLQIKPEGHKIFVHFLQKYRSKILSDVGMKELVLCRESGEWKIFRERWVDSR